MKSLTRRINLKSQGDTIIGNENAISIEDNLINILINATLN
jgi:phosphoglycerate-specific signal transduction histidine kinase